MSVMAPCLHPGALRQFALGVERHLALVAQGQSNKVILYPSHGNLMWGSPPWSCFAILQHAVKTVGPRASLGAVQLTATAPIWVFWAPEVAMCCAGMHGREELDMALPPFLSHPSQESLS